MADQKQEPFGERAREAPVRNRTQKPPGTLPKNAQTWVIAGLSAVMVAAIALSGNSGAKNKSAAGPSREASVIDPNAGRIAEYRSRLDEETRKVAAEQAALNQAKQGLAATVPGVGSPGTASGTINPSQPPEDERAAQRKQIEAEKARKEYSSLFASNIALSYRKEAASSDIPIPQVPSTASPAQAAAYPYPYIYAGPQNAPRPSAPGDPATGTAAQSAAADKQLTPEESVPRRAKPDPELSRADGKAYVLLEGTILETVLTNRLTGSLAGPVNTMLTTDVYSHDRQHLLLPQGTRVLGEVKPVNSFSQDRLAVVFHRMIMPDGYSLLLDQFRGMNQIGETGLRDQVNRHYIEIFGVSIAIGAIAGLSQANTQYGFSESAADVYRQGFAGSLSQSSMRILDRFLNILPTFTVREGYRIRIYLAADLPVPAYDRHRTPNDF